MAGGNKPARVPMGVNGVFAGAMRLAANAFHGGSADDDDSSGEEEILEAGGAGGLFFISDDDEDEDKAKAVAYTRGQIEAHRRGRGRYGFGNYWGPLGS